ncbi:hypothetical protein CEXT_316951 [Caerostris extrusa]|uniref:Uncharacterized protein n=1 Tax=Caerostris extrusa TaxID=172846 RepID=A0AAV4WFC6_CAEEX|nr:hypothetical protein CEXT_316951 [Caerostris extrusa]
MWELTVFSNRFRGELFTKKGLRSATGKSIIQGPRLEDNKCSGIIMLWQTVGENVDALTARSATGSGRELFTKKGLHSATGSGRELFTKKVLYLNVVTVHLIMAFEEMGY